LNFENNKNKIGHVFFSLTRLGAGDRRDINALELAKTKEKNMFLKVRFYETSAIFPVAIDILILSPNSVLIH
jgi:hypothetical protein